ncbi:hypothetical protein Tco_0440282, partial [Tanacetum coccineum]
FSRRLSSFLLEGNGIDAFWLGLEALTRGGTSSVLPLLVGGIVSFVTSGSHSTTLGEEVV